MVFGSLVWAGIRRWRSKFPQCQSERVWNCRLLIICEITPSNHFFSTASMNIQCILFLILELRILLMCQNQPSTVADVDPDWLLWMLLRSHALQEHFCLSWISNQDWFVLGLGWQYLSLSVVNAADTLWSAVSVDQFPLHYICSNRLCSASWVGAHS